MSIPDKIKVGCYEYDVIKTDQPLIIGNRSDYVGIADHNNITIKIKSDMSEQVHEQVFWHEVLHCIENQYGLELGDDREKIIDAFANGIYAIMKDNNFPMPGQSLK